MRRRSTSKKNGVILIIIAVAAIVTALKVFANKSDSLSKIRTPLKTDFSVEIELSYDDWNSKGILTKSSEEYTITLNEPEEIKGMEFKYDGNKVTINYLGLAKEISNDSLLLNSVSSSIIECINNALAGKFTSIVEDGDNYIVKGTIDNGNYEMTVEQSTGMPLSLKISRINLTCTFKEIEYVESETE